MNFDGIAPHYTLLESVTAGRSVHRCRTAYIDSLAHSDRLLLMGEGTGRFLTDLLRRWPDKQVTVVDSSRRMLTRQRQSLEKANLADDRVEFLHRDARRWNPPSGGYDAIVTHFFLDCFNAEELAALIPAIAVGARPGAIWLVSDFNRPDRLFSGWRAGVILRLMYGFFRATTDLSADRLIPPGAQLEAAGFELRERRRREWGLLQADLWKKTEKAPPR
jgi:ubiquinone/menaquinone biosynthesis C-methylase UbiE